MKRILLTLTIALGLMVPLGAVAGAADPAATTPTNTTSAPTASNSAAEDACQGVGLVSGNGGCDSDTGGASVSSIIKTGLNLLSWVAGIAAVVMVIYGGLKFILSQGDASNITSARNTILYALVGLVVVALSQFIVRFVLNKSAKPAPTAPGQEQQQNQNQTPSGQSGPQ